MVLFDSHGYSTQAGTHAVYRTVVIYALRLSGQHRTVPVAQSHIQSTVHTTTVTYSMFTMLLPQVIFCKYIY